MLRRFIRFSSALVLLLCGNAWALGLGEIRLESSLNSPLRAEIELLSATEEELDNLVIALASAETFERYDLDRSADLQGLEFQVIRSGRTDGNVVRVRSRSPITEPFLTFLVEATWSRGRLLREYTLLLDPPTFAPPTPAQPAVAAPERTTPADSGSIRREPPPPTPAAEPPARVATPPASRPAPAPSAAVEERPVDTAAFDATPGGDYVVTRNETLWGIAQRVRPDARLSMNQTMLAIYEANREAFGGNINLLREGASLRIPSADEIFQIDRGDALSEVQRQHSAWDGSVATAAPAVEDSRPNLTLVPPDEDSIGVGAGDDRLDEPPLSREEEVERRITELEAETPVDRALIEIRDNELAALREELARIRGEVYEPPVDEAPVDEPVVDDVVVDTTDDSPFIDEAPAEELVDDELFPDFEDEVVADDDSAEAPADEAEVEDTTAPPAVVRTAVQPTLVDRILGALTSIWTIIGAALVVAAGVLFWFMRRGRGEDEELGPWTSEPLADFESDQDTLTATESLKAPKRDDGSIVVVEQGSAGQALEDDTVETPAAQPGSGDAVSLEDTFSSETGVNLDQTDPIAEADFHMAYGLYDQAADLINGALAVEPERQDLLTKLCEIYFVWGNRDAFIDAAGRVRAAIGDAGSADWDKIVIMGQQIAADHELFAGAGIAGATKAVDLAFESDTGDTGALDMEFGDDSSGGEVIDLGAGGSVDEVVDLGTADSADDLLDVGAVGAPHSNDDSALDFDFGEDAEDDTATTRESPTIEASMTEKTVEMPGKDSTVETPTIEQPAADLAAASPGETSELPSIDEETIGGAILDGGPDRDQAGDHTAEIDLDDLGLDLSGLEETEVASLDDLDETSDNEALEITGVNKALEDSQAATVEQAADEADATGMQPALDADSSGLSEALDEIEEALTSTQTGMRLAPDETGVSPFMDTVEDTDTGIDHSLLDATGRTQVLSEDLAVETAAGTEPGLGDQDATLLAGLDEADEAEDTDDDDHADTQALGDDDATMLAPGLGEGDFDFAKTEALPPEAFTGNTDLDQTGELPAVASTDVDLDLDDLTAALKISEAGDTVDMPRDDKTVEQPRPQIADEYAGAETMELDPDDMSDDLQDARTMTEVGTKLDLARAYVDMGDPGGARSILEEVLDEGDESQRQQAQQLLDTLPG